MSQAYLIYDERMELHADQDESTKSARCERPQRIVSIIEKLMSLQSRLQRNHEIQEASPLNEITNSPFIYLACEPASQETIELAHTSDYYNRLKETSIMTIEELNNMQTINLSIKDGSNEEDADMYFCNDTFQAALLACGGVKQCVDAVTSTDSQSRRALAIVRPPGHHACQQKAMGFCFFNSVVVAAKHAIKSQRAKRVVIVDWDIHHGNGSQDMTYNDPDILYISIHRYGPKFFPGTGRASEVGGGDDNVEAVGSNVNIAWTRGHMGNTEYAAVMSELILPLMASFRPDLILVSCGLDAAKGGK